MRRDRTTASGMNYREKDKNQKKEKKKKDEVEELLDVFSTDYAMPWIIAHKTDVLSWYTYIFD